jgi:hypothetical protein
VYTEYENVTNVTLCKGVRQQFVYLVGQGRVAEMKLLFTKLQEEITTVRKSVTRFGVETGNSDCKAAEFPVIELKPESQSVEFVKPNRPPKASLDTRKIPLALSSKAEQIGDVVDLRGISKKEALSPISYSASGALQAKPNLEGFENDCRQEKVSVYSKSDNGDTFSALDERRAHYQITTRKFIATQQMVEYHNSREKRLSFELTI